jgi:Rrf2 family nitric oxide-sensitive transcriptional repressor
MRVSRFADYSLRLLMHLAALPGGRSTIGEAAAALQVSRNHLVKIVHLLGRHGVLANTRGRRGGMRLADAPARINVGRVMRLVETTGPLVECFDAASNTCTLAPACRLRGMLSGALESFYRSLERYTLEHLTISPPPPDLAPLRRRTTQAASSGAPLRRR